MYKTGTKIRILFLALFVNLSLFSGVFAQFTGSKHLNESIREISEFIASSEFTQMKEDLNSSDLIDSLYLYSRAICNYNNSETLLALMFATLPYHHVPLKLPGFNKSITVPLPSTGKKLFQKKLENLPTNVFFKSDYKNYDKDKLAHYFGNAFLSYNLGFFNISKFMSIFVELFENSFKVEGAVDFRDLQVNMLGESFGLALNKNENLRPSDFNYVYYFFYKFISV